MSDMVARRIPGADQYPWTTSGMAAWFRERTRQQLSPRRELDGYLWSTPGEVEESGSARRSPGQMLVAAYRAMCVDMLGAYVENGGEVGAPETGEWLKPGRMAAVLREAHAIP